MSLLKKCLIGVVVLGLVVTAVVLTTGAALTIPNAPHAPQRAVQTVQAVGYPTDPAALSYPDQAAIDTQAAVDRQAAIDALNAQQAQALADQLQAAANRLAAAAPTPPAAPVVTTPAALPDGYGCGGVNQYAAFIYYHESGCNPGSVNGSGCAGIGQACPGSKMPCGLTQADFTCQDAYFTDYAVGRYGSWEAAYQFWIGHNWW